MEIADSGFHWSFLDSPILEFQAIYPLELANVVGDQNETVGECLSCDQHVVRANDLAFALEVRAKMTIRSSGLESELQCWQILE